jgi:hypothetical protein
MSNITGIEPTSTEGIPMSLGAQWRLTLAVLFGFFGAMYALIRLMIWSHRGVETYVCLIGFLVLLFLVGAITDFTVEMRRQAKLPKRNTD